MVITKIYNEPSVCKKEILRYAGCKDIGKETIPFETERSSTELLLEECLKEVLPKLSYKVCYIELPLVITEQTCDFGCMKVESQDLAKNLQNCEKVILFAATIGVEIDRLIMKYGAVSPAKAMMFQAIGAERIESLCDAFCKKPRFSPGYGDLPLETQKDIFQVLGCSRNIGLSLNDSLLMSPSKSVTAFVGIEEVTPGGIMMDGADEAATKEDLHNCAVCNKTDCAYRI